MPPERHDVHLTATSQVPSILAFPETREGPAHNPGELSPGRRAGARVLVGGVGYSCLGDLSAGPILIERLRERAWPPGVVVEDLSYGPIDVLFKLQASPPFRAGIFISAVARGREPGSLQRVAWSAAPLAPDELQARIAEAITGVISLENLLHILGHFGALPGEVVVFEIEPLGESWGLDLSGPVQAALAAAERAVEDELERLLGQEARQ